MGLVDDDRVVAAEQPVAVDLVQEDAVGHERDEGLVGHVVGEAHLVADEGAERHLELFGDALGDRPGREPARLRVGDARAAELEADLRQLRRLARPGGSGDDHDLVASMARAISSRAALTGSSGGNEITGTGAGIALHRMTRAGRSAVCRRPSITGRGPPQP